ncbi:uncharacterized protein LOC113324121 [Papaver somniferum]|uniref:uncharacterized protein LOC113324121 n=1 Tax=Papaver somniferum TaxID=3469 RepID=UPI000E6FA08A|nr:uncharacterized protein LOC113324121 [Papaver somniferum]
MVNGLKIGDNHLLGQNNLQMKVAEMLNGKIWKIPRELQSALNMERIPDIGEGTDTMKPSWASVLWKYFLHPNIACNVWKLLQGIYTDDETMRKQGYEMPSRCCVCIEEQDSMEHTLWECNFSVQIWDWLCAIFNFSKPLCFNDICRAARNHSPLMKEIWITAVCATVRDLWFQRNAIFFGEGRPDINRFKCKIYQVVHEGGGRMKGNRWGHNYDSQIISFSNWVPGFGIIARDSNCQVIGTLSGGVGITSNFIAEIYAVLCALEWATFLQLKKIIVRSHSKAVIILANNNRVPWEINFSADSLAKKGATLAAGERICHFGRPQTLKRIEMPDTPYYRFC